jgi:hypothetical protein
MRYLPLSTPLLVVLAIAGPARAGADEPTTEPTASNAFMIRLAATPSKEDVIQQIVEAGHDQLAAACAVTPAASVRILNPLAAGDHADVACSTILDGGESVGQSSEALTSGREELVGQARQPLTPVGPLICGFASLIAMTAGARACADWRGENSQFCNVGNFGTGAAWLFACHLLF